MTNDDKRTQRPTRRAIALRGALLGMAVGFLIWLTATYPDNPRWYDWLGVGVWGFLVAWDGWDLIKALKRRWVPRKDITVECPSCEGRGNQPDGPCWDCQGTGEAVYVV